MTFEWFKDRVAGGLLVASICFSCALGWHLSVGLSAMQRDVQDIKVEMKETRSDIKAEMKETRSDIKTEISDAQARQSAVLGAILTPLVTSVNELRQQGRMQQDEIGELYAWRAYHTRPNPRSSK